MASTNGEQCHFYLQRKKRYCRFRPKPNQTYCPEHAWIMGIQEDRKRIPCPLNPNHNCYEDDLKNHLKKCNVTKIQQAYEKLPYFVKDINKGSQEDCKDELRSTVGPVRELTSEKLGRMIEKVNKLFSKVVESIDKLHLEHPCIKEEIVGDSNLDLNTALGNQAVLRKEILQQGSLVGQLNKCEFLSNGHHFVELGAGKGKLSHWIQKACQKCTDNSYLLVERGSVRYKVDSHHKEKEGSFHRIKIDIQDLCLGKVSDIQDKTSIVVVGKHLCGGATDLGIRCAVNTLKPSNATHDADVESSKSEKSHVVATETCVNNISSMKEKSHEHLATAEKGEEAITLEVTSGAEIDMNLRPSHDIEDSLKCTCEDNDKATGDKSVDNSKTSVGEFSHSDGSLEPPAKISRLQNEQQSESKLKGLMIALCCHHRCTWDTYIGREFMRTHGINEEEFDLLTRLSSWATCARIRIKDQKKKKDPGQEKDKSCKEGEKKQTGDGCRKEEVKEETKEEHNVEDLISMDLSDNIPLREKLSVSEREAIGRKSKRIIDMGRIEYLRSKNMICCLREYIDENITPENVVLIATAPNQIKS